jgi:hypothetical protein
MEWRFAGGELDRRATQRLSGWKTVDMGCSELYFW